MLPVVTFGVSSHFFKSICIIRDFTIRFCFFKSTGISSSPTTLYDRYSSPTAHPTRRRLFVDNDNTSDNGTPVRVSQQPVVNTVPVQNVNPEAVSVTPVPGQTLVTVATATVTANNGQTVTIPVQGKRRAAVR